MHRAGAHLDVERLLQEAAARGPELRQLEDELLQRDHSYRTSFQLSASVPSHLAQDPADFSSFSSAGHQPRWSGSSSREPRRRPSDRRFEPVRRRRPGGRQETASLDADSRAPPDGAQRRHTNMSSRGGMTAPPSSGSAQPAHAQRRIHALQPQQPGTRNTAPALRPARRRRSRRPSTRPAGTTARRRAPPAPTRRCSSAKYPTWPERLARLARRASGDRASST